MSISEPFIRRPVATTLLTAAIALSGIVAFQLLPVSPLPQVDFPTIQVSAGLPGANPETMASAVATPLERQFSRIAGVAEMTSTSYLGFTGIVLQFDLSRDINAAARDVQAAINAARGNLPANLPNNPGYRKVNPADAPILILSLTSRIADTARMYDAASSMLQQKLSQVEGVGQVFVGGSSLPAVRVELNPGVIDKYGIGLEQVRTVLAGANANRPKGEFSGPAKAWQIRTTDQLLKADQYRPLIVAYQRNAPVRLADLGRVQDSVEDLRNAGLANGNPAVLVVIFRQPGANIIDTVDRVRALLPQFQAAIPPFIHLGVMVDRTTTIRASIHDVEWTLMASIGLVILVVFVFLRNGWATFVPGVAVPLSLIGTFGVMYLLGYSLDNLSLMALTVSTGFVVDDAIVVIENISRHLEHGLHPMEAALRGSREIGFTVISISISLVAVFIPILMMGGIVGRLFREFAVTLSVAIIVSMVISLTTTPMMCARLLKHQPPEGHGRLYRATERAFQWIVNAYAAALRVVLRHPAVTLMILLATIAVNLYLFVIIPKGFFPEQDTGRLMGIIQAQQNISFQAMRKKFTGFVDTVMSDPAVSNVVGFTGGSGGTNTGRMFVQLKDLDQRVGVQEVIGRIRRKAAGVPGASLFLQPVQDIRIGGRMSGAEYQFTLRGQDLAELSAWSTRMLNRLRTMPELTDVNTDQQDKGLEAWLDIDRDTASRMRLSMSQIDSTLYDAFGQRPVSTIYTELNQYHVVMEVAPEFWQSPDTLKTIYVRNQTGGEVPLAAFTRMRPATTPLVVNHQGLFPAATISFNLKPGVSLGEAVDAVNAAERDMGMPAGIHGSFSGTAEAFQSSLASEPFLIVAALVAVYIVLGILYESYIHPVTILSTLPSAGVGALLALLFRRTELTVIALIGIILLIGIVKKNAILMIDFALDAERREGRSSRDAIYEACLLRFRPILMTTLAALLGAMPLALGAGTGGELRRPLGLAIVGGLIVSQLLTLFTTPVVYLFLDRLRLWLRRLRRASVQPALGCIVAAVVSVMLAGCGVGPRYSRPTAQAPSAYKELPPGNDQWKNANPSDGELRGNWWELFGDARLNALEQSVAGRNQTVQQAAARFRQARALVGINRASYFPTLSSQPGLTTSYASTNLGSHRLGNQGAFTLFDLPFSVSWEPNFWGRTSLAVENAVATAQAGAADLQNALLSMQGELAVDYFLAEGLDMQMLLLRDTIAGYERALQLTFNRHNAGVASKADVVQAQAQLEAARAQLTDLGVSRAQLEHAIAVLTGEAPAAFTLAPGEIHGLPPPIPTGVPSRLLERRPDIASAERLVAAANAQIGLARTAYFPNAVLNATAGMESGSFTNWLSWPSRFWSLGPSVAQTVLDFGRRRGQAQQAQAAYDLTVATYRQTVLGAFQEVEDNLAALRLLAQEATEQAAAVEAAEESLALEMDRYKAGTVSYLDVITAQNIAYADQRAAVEILQRRMTAAVQLIRGLGGGWDASALPTPAGLRPNGSASSHGP